MRIASLLFVVAAALAGGTACKGDGVAAAVSVVPGAPAGDVTELAGAVHATRDGKTRAIAKGDVVSGDDVIATGDDGRVTIVLRHNGVTWSLGPRMEKKLADSAAWSAAKGAAAEVATDDKSAAAGRHAERSATDTAASTNADHDQAVQAAQDDADRRAAQERLEALQQDRADMEERVAAAKAAADRAERKKGVHVTQACLDNPLAKGCDDDVPEAPADPSKLKATVGAHVDALRACYTKLRETSPKARGTLVVRVNVGADGKVISVDVAGSDELAPMRACVTAVIEGLAFPAPGSPVGFDYPLELKP
jgi:hypothetical protein